MRTLLSGLSRLSIILIALYSACTGENTTSHPPDLAPNQDMPPAVDKGCIGNQIPLASNVVGCPGSFEKGGASLLCAAGWHLCAQNETFDTALCSQLAGFMMSPSFGTAVGQDWTHAQCRQPTAVVSDFPVIFGCGGRSQPAFVHTNAMSCYGFTASIDCTTTGSSIDCRNGGNGNNQLSDTANTNAENGVLCCKTK